MQFTAIFRFTCKVGDEIQVDQNVMEIETDKTTVGVPTPMSGVIEEIFVKDGDTVKAGQDLFKIKPGPVSGKPAAAPAQAAAPPKPAAPQAAPKAAAAAPPPPPPPTPRATPPPPPPRPQAPASSVPIAAIRHAQAVEASVKVCESIVTRTGVLLFPIIVPLTRFRCHLQIIREK